MPEMMIGDQIVWVSEAQSRNSDEYVTPPISGTGSPPAVAVSPTVSAAETRRAQREATLAERRRNATVIYLLSDLKTWTDILIEARSWIGLEITDRQVRQEFSSMTTPGQVPTPDDFNQLRGQINQASSGNMYARAALCRLLSPKSLLWESVMDIPNKVEAFLISRMTGSERQPADPLQDQLVTLRETLGAATASILERVLIERVVVSWLHVQWAEAACGTARKKRDVEHLKGVLSAANRFYGLALQALQSARSQAESGPSAVQPAR